jgi:calpain-7
MDTIQDLIDWETKELKDLEQQISQISSLESSRALIIQAAELCIKYHSQWLSPPVKWLFLQRLKHFLEQGENVKAAITGGSSFHYEVFVAKDPPLGLKRREPQIQESESKQQKILLLKQSKLGNTKFSPWPKGGITSEVLEKPPQTQAEPSLSSQQVLHFDKWASPTELFNIGSDSISMKAINPPDLVQDIGVDCSVVASMCAIMAELEVGDKILAEIMYPKDVMSDRYFFQFHLNGCKRAVEIDNLLPASKSDRVLHANDRNNPTLLWPALLEKAYLTIWGGYNFRGSNSNTDLSIMTGWIPELVIMNDEGVREDFLWPKMWGGIKSQTLLVTFGTSDLDPISEKAYGLAAKHAYAVLDVKVENNEALVLLKNPWNEETKTIWQPGKISGTFWIPFHESRRHFKWAYLNWYPGIFKHRKDLHFIWNIARQTSAAHAEKTPQFALRNPAKSDQLVWILLSRHFQDTEDGQKHATGHISIWACNRNGNKVYDVDLHSVSHSISVDSMQVLLSLVIPKETTYTIVPRQEDACLGDHYFTLSAFSDASVVLTEATQPLSNMMTIKDNWYRDLSAMGNIEEPEFYRNPQYLLEVTEPTHVAISLESFDPTIAVNVMLYHSGKQIFTVKQDGIAVGTTEYRDGYSAIRTPDWKPLHPMKYTILVSTGAVDQASHYALHCESDVPVVISRISGEEWLSNRFKPPRAPFSHDANILAIPFHISRSSVANFRVVAHFAPSKNRNDYQSPIQISIERGQGPHKQIISQTGTPERPFQDVPKQGLRLMEQSLFGDGSEYFLVLYRIPTTRPVGSVECWDLQMIIEDRSLNKELITIGHAWIVKEE